MQFVAIRVTRPADELTDLVARLKEHCDVFVGYEHTPDQGCSRPHIHALLGNYTKTKTTFYNWCKSYGITDASDYFYSEFHSKKCNCCRGKKKVDISFITYESKGRLEPIGLKGIGVEEVGELRARWVDSTTISVDPLRRGGGVYRW